MSNFIAVATIFLLCATQVSCSPHEPKSVGAKNDEVSEPAKLIIENNKLMNQLAGKIGGKAGEAAFNMVAESLFPDLFSQQEAINYDKIREIFAEEIAAANRKQTDVIIAGGFEGLNEAFRLKTNIWLKQVKNAHQEMKNKNKKQRQVIKNRIADDTKLAKLDMTAYMSTHISEVRHQAAQADQAKVSIASYVALSNLQQSVYRILDVMESTLHKSEYTGEYVFEMRARAEESRAHIGKWLQEMRIERVTCAPNGKTWNLVDLGDSRFNFPGDPAFYATKDHGNCILYYEVLMNIYYSETEDLLACGREIGVEGARVFKRWNYTMEPFIKHRVPAINRKIIYANEQICNDMKRIWQTGVKRMRDPRTNKVFAGLLEIADSWIE